MAELQLKIPLMQTDLEPCSFCLAGDLRREEYQQCGQNYPVKIINGGRLATHPRLSPNFKRDLPRVR
jgi:hypothetical protein